MDPASPVSEMDRTNVTLFCDIIDGNPEALVSVKWFMDGVLLKQLPLCTEDENSRDNDLCDIDPSQLVLEHVSRLFDGNYSCQGSNGAGWSRPSPEVELQVFCKTKDQHAPWLTSVEPRTQFRSAWSVLHPA